MNSTIKPKMKPCKENGHMSYLWSHGYCKHHWMIRTAKKQIAEKKESGVAEKDEKFYRYIWNKRPHICDECGTELLEFSFDWFHHLLAKKKGIGGYPYFRWEEINIGILCGRYGCHKDAESAIKYPKMKVFPSYEARKISLLESVEMTYNSKMNMQ